MKSGNERRHALKQYVQESTKSPRGKSRTFQKTDSNANESKSLRRLSKFQDDNLDEIERQFQNEENNEQNQIIY